MSATPAAYIAFTAPINPAGASTLSREQIWAGLQRKVRHAEEFVGGAIKSTDVISESKDEHGREVITREVVFREGDRRVKEVCTLFEPMKVEVSHSYMQNGSRLTLLSSCKQTAQGCSISFQILLMDSFI